MDSFSDREKFIVLLSNDFIVKSDAIVILEGDGEFRVAKAAELYKKGFARNVVFSGGLDKPQSGAYTFKKLEAKIVSQGIPKEIVIVEAESTNTRQQAEEVLKLCKIHKWESIILVASHYHQYRAFLTFLKHIEEENFSLIIHNAPSNKIPWFSKNTWGKRIDLLEIEFNKINEYQDLGHVSNFSNAIKYFKWKETKLV